MPNLVQNIQKNIKSGTCPHGLPSGTCPICSMGGGGRKADKNYTRPGEMSYHQCEVIGNILRARALARKQQKNLFEHFAEKAKQFEKSLTSLHSKINIFTQKISKNIPLKIVAFAIQMVAVFPLNIIKNASSLFVNVIEKLGNVKKIIADVTEKLTAIFGEIKNFINKKLEKTAEFLKSTLKKLTKIFKKNDTDNEDTKIDDDKKIFNLKKFLKKLKKREGDNDNS